MRKLRADTLAIDLGTDHCGMAALFRHYGRDDEGRYGYHTVETWYVALEDLGDEIRHLRPRTVLAEEPARGSATDKAERAIAILQRSCKAVGAPLCLANVSTWKKDAAGTHRANPETMKALTLARLEAINVATPKKVWASASLDKDELAALRLLACWRPVKAVLSRGRSPTKITASGKRSSQVRRCSKSAQRLYGVLYEAAMSEARPGIRLQCKSAKIAVSNYYRFLGELVEQVEIELRYAPDGSLQEIML